MSINIKRLSTRQLFTSLILFLIIYLLEVNIVYAGGLDGFMKFAQQNGALTSVNAGGIIEDQQSGFLTGGSIISRGPGPKQLQPIAIQIPSFAFDPCTGSGDLRWGGLSYIKASEFTKYFKSVATSAGAYVAKMAIKQACPQCEDIMSYLESVARDINGMTFGQCEQGKAIAEGLMGKVHSAHSQKCMVKSAIIKGGSDLYETTEKCQDDPDRFGNQGDDNELKSMLPDNYNLVWKALSHGDGSASNGMKELLMSVSGSIIGKKVGSQVSISTLPSLIEKDDLLERYIGKPGVGTSKVKIYHCDESHKCLNPIAKEKDISSSKDSLYGKVEATIKSIVIKIDKNEGELNDEESALVEYSQIPLISLLEIEIALKNKDNVLALAGQSEFIEVVCYDLVTNFMRKMLVEAKTAVDAIETSQVDNTPIDRFNKNVENVQALLLHKNHKAMAKLQTIIAVKERLNQQQRVFQIGFSRFADN